MGSTLIYPAHGILVSSMKTLIQILLLALLVGCASPYYPVYVNDAGDYYIAERATEGPYYGTGYYPWSLSAYPPQTFAYYSPYFYPYYFSVWYPPAHSPYYGILGGNYPYWRPSYPNLRHPGHNRMVVSPVMPPVTDRGQVVTYPGRSVQGQRIVAPPRSASAYNRTPAQPFVPASRMSSSSAARFSLPSTHSGLAGRGKVDSSSRSVRHRQ